MYIYGTMDDDDDRQAIEERLQNLENSNRELLTNNNKQVTINKQFNEQFFQLQEPLKQSSKTLAKYKDIKSEINTLRIELEFNRNLVEVQQIIEQIDNIIMTSRTGILTQDIVA